MWSQCIRCVTVQFQQLGGMRRIEALQNGLEVDVIRLSARNQRLLRIVIVGYHAGDHVQENALLLDRFNCARMVFVGIAFGGAVLTFEG